MPLLPGPNTSSWPFFADFRSAFFVAAPLFFRAGRILCLAYLCMYVPLLLPANDRTTEASSHNISSGGIRRELAHDGQACADAGEPTATLAAICQFLK